MKYQSQGEDECVLATIAMLAGVSMTKAREVAAEVAEEITGIPSYRFKWKDTLESLREIYCRVVSLKLGLRKPILCTAEGKIHLLSDTPNLSGKGQLILIRVIGQGKFRWLRLHSIAYENNEIYDPDNVWTRSWKSLCKKKVEYGYFILNSL